jgi:tRNA (cytidine/uridine-2'-O-)-methyltransferase
MFGKETKGLPEKLLYDNYENCVRIPMRQTLRSLNLSNSVAVAVYEVLRQRDFEGLEEKGKLTQYVI